MLAAVNSAAVNIGVHMSLSDLVSLVCMPLKGLLGHMVVLFLVFKGISVLFSIGAVPICIPTHSVGEFPFLHTLPSIYCLQIFFFYDDHSDQCEVIVIIVLFAFL